MEIYNSDTKKQFLKDYAPLGKSSSSTDALQFARICALEAHYVYLTDVNARKDVSKMDPDDFNLVMRALQEIDPKWYNDNHIVMTAMHHDNLPD